MRLVAIAFRDDSDMKHEVLLARHVKFPTQPMNSNEVARREQVLVDSVNLIG